MECYIAYQLERLIIPVVVNWAADQAIPMSQDVLPNSPFLQNLNAQYEPFARASVSGWSEKRWMLSRLLGDNFSTGSNLQGRRWVRYTQYAYDGFYGCATFAFADGDYGIGDTCAQIAHAMDGVDRIWDQLTAPGDNSDGIVQGQSQSYPNNSPGGQAPFRYIIHDSDSHVGETRSGRTQTQLRQVLPAAPFNVPVR
jgi:hypothetical protein